MSPIFVAAFFTTLAAQIDAARANDVSTMNTAAQETVINALNHRKKDVGDGVEDVQYYVPLAYPDDLGK